MNQLSNITVELYGLPRHRAGCAEVQIAPGTVAQVLGALQRTCPRLGTLVDGDGRVAPHYLLSIDGQRFVTSLDEKMPAGTRLLLLSADAGG